MRNLTLLFNFFSTLLFIMPGSARRCEFVVSALRFSRFVDHQFSLADLKFRPVGGVCEI